MKIRLMCRSFFRRRGSLALRLTTHSNTTNGILPITLIGSDLNCSMSNDVSVAVPLRMDGESCEQEQVKQCELTKESVTSGFNHCSFDCSCANFYPCEIDIFIFSGKTKYLCEIIKGNTFIVDVS